MSIEQAALPPRGAAWRRLVRDRGGVIAAVVLAALVVVAVGAGTLSPDDPFRTSTQRLQAPSRQHVLGTDDLGRDQLSRVLYGGRTSLRVGLSVALIATLIGVAVGGTASYAGGLVDDALMRLTELVQVVPRFFAALVLVAIVRPRVSTIVLVLGFTSWPIIARILRAEALSVKRREFVTAALATGVSGPRILVRHILPLALTPVIVAGSLEVGGAILAEAGLSFLGVGDPRAVSWGSMLQAVQPFMRSAPWLALAPGLAITLTVIAVNRFGEALNDLWAPRARSASIKENAELGSTTRQRAAVR